MLRNKAEADICLLTGHMSYRAFAPVNVCFCVSTPVDYLDTMPNPVSAAC